MKTLCALIGAFFLVGGIAVLVSGAPKSSRRAGLARSETRVARDAGPRPLLWEADGASRGARATAEAVSRRP
ncbi:MAG TPA: hypothetical protein VFS34_03665 [Thermoanaerobaculia bacterium]|nr:hypothetical protein [Thermoanaerobaculia bacterium]